MFHITQRTVMDVRREGGLTPEMIGSAKMLHDFYSRLGQLDDPGVDHRLKKECEAEVREKYPDNELWYASGDGDQESSAEST